MTENNPALEGQTFEIIKDRLQRQASVLSDKLEQLNSLRKSLFGGVETALINSARITTQNNCFPRDIVTIKRHFLLGYNVTIGLKTTTLLEDVFAIYSFEGDQFNPQSLDLIRDPQFESDFQDLYKYYKKTRFAKFSVIGDFLYMIFHVGSDSHDIKTFKWFIDGNKLTYVDNRSDHEYKLPPHQDFEWTKVTRDQHRGGEFPHISIEDRVFVEAVGGDITVKVEDNTETGEGVYAEAVQEQKQTLDDGDYFYAIVGPIILIKIRPYLEKQYRYLVFNEKTREVKRIDAIEQSCVLLPSDHGLIFPKGYYLQSGESKIFETSFEDMTFKERVQSPNGEDTLFVFYNRYSGTYLLYSYNVISRSVDPPIVCHGYALLEDGKLVFFKASSDAVKHHMAQIWQTPFSHADFERQKESDHFLAKIGNKEIVQCMAECREIIKLVEKETPYESLYLDLERSAVELLDTYFWLDNEDAFALKDPLLGIKNAASSAIGEFEKLMRQKRASRKAYIETKGQIEKLERQLRLKAFDRIQVFVQGLIALRTLRGQIQGLKDLPYILLDKVEELEKRVQDQSESLSANTVQFLLKPSALDTYWKAIDQIASELDASHTVVEVSAKEQELQDQGKELDLLIEIVSNLKIEDATQTTAILDRISEGYARLNQIRASLKKRKKELQEQESSLEFISQTKLLDQTLISYLDICDSVEACETYLSKLMLQLEELEGKFSEHETYLEALMRKREEFHATFESRKLQILEKKNRRTNHLLRSAERILQGAKNRLATFQSEEEINTYFSSDLLIDKVRQTAKELFELGDSVKSDDITARVAALRQEALHQLSDRQDLFEDGSRIVKFGKHRFSVNNQKLDLTLIQREDSLETHLTGTAYFETVSDDAIHACKNVWSQALVSENDQVYRAEYLAYTLLMETDAPAKLDEPEVLAFVQAKMAKRYNEGYEKGVHDFDAMRMYLALRQFQEKSGLLSFAPDARACGRLFWVDPRHTELVRDANAFFQGLGAIHQLFDSDTKPLALLPKLQAAIASFVETIPYFSLIDPAVVVDYLKQELGASPHFAVSEAADKLKKVFLDHLKAKNQFRAYSSSLTRFESDALSRFFLTVNWLEGFCDETDHSKDYVLETAVLLSIPGDAKVEPQQASALMTIEDLRGSHRSLPDGPYSLNYHRFMQRLDSYARQTVPAFLQFQKVKHDFLERERNILRLSEFEPRVLSSFVRNRLIDELYLPLIGDNLAKQIGTVGPNTRTDRMGMLLLVSPPGYGKTTLMEYLANRLGLIFMKINGPAIGHLVTSLDPEEAPNASARDEVNKLNLALEMGDNVMIYLDDIQHCNPEFLQKFISLCDATRKMEGVFRGRSKTYDLRGKKVAVVMAGNPYTESGDKFRIPDMLANRADTYNLGDIIGSTETIFKLSYLENSLTSNPVLSQLKSHRDIHAVLSIIEHPDQDAPQFEGSYSPEDVADFVDVLKKLLIVRDVILRVNQEYIKSAAMEDAYRTEPAFKLQGSYRNMNKLAEKVLPVMNREELNELILTHYENEAQTLTQGSEANLLKFKKLNGFMSEKERSRWDAIVSTFQKNQEFLNVDPDNQLGQLMVRLTSLKESLVAIDHSLTDGFQNIRAHKPKESRTIQAQFDSDSLSTLLKVSESFSQQLKNLETKIEQATTPKEPKVHDGIPSELLQQHGIQIQQVGPSQFNLHQPPLEPIELNARGKHMRFEMPAGYLRADSNDVLIKELRKVNRQIFPFRINSAEQNDGLHHLSIQLKLEKDMINSLQFLAVFEGMTTYQHTVMALIEKLENQAPGELKKK